MMFTKYLLLPATLLSTLQTRNYLIHQHSGESVSISPNLCKEAKDGEIELCPYVSASTRL